MKFSTNDVMKIPYIILGLTMSVLLSGCSLMGVFYHETTSEESDFNHSILHGVRNDKDIISIEKHHMKTFGEKPESPFLEVNINGSTVYGDLGEEDTSEGGNHRIITPNITEDEMQTFWRVFYREVSKTDFIGRVILDIYPAGKKRQFSATIHGTRPVTIFDAFEKRDMFKVREMLKRRPELASSKERHGLTLLHYAALFDDVKIAELLLSYNADVNAEDSEGYTPLHVAVKAGRMKVMELLLANGAKVDARDKMRITPLYLAASNGHKEMAQILLNHKADLSAKSISGTTPLHVAAEYCRKDVVVLLLANKADINAKRNDGFTPLHLAAMNAHPDVVEVLLANHAKINIKTEGDPALDESGSTPLLLISYNFVPDDRKIKVMKLLLASGSDVNARNKSGWTSLHFAAWRGRKKVAELLLASNPNVNIKDENGDTPLAFAIRGNHKDVVDLLRQHGAHE